MPSLSISLETARGAFVRCGERLAWGLFSQIRMYFWRPTCPFKWGMIGLLIRVEPWNWVVFIAVPGLLLITTAALWLIMSGLAGIHSASPGGGDRLLPAEFSFLKRTPASCMYPGFPLPPEPQLPEPPPDPFPPQPSEPIPRA